MAGFAARAGFLATGGEETRGLAGWRLAWRKRRQYVATVRELEALTDKELDDIGAPRPT